ncbi:beta-N-acetylhexosaminidase [Granulicella sp. dw_53]|uniref:beta-N-acetylhexosaminidase n=1 Tax=Granulicella sp. dw_53 TaxID=2719792 RepID=UPI0021026554|nr:beta-N-acetylhexosaminidase [Granulicella sp. dw_53]
MHQELSSVPRGQRHATSLLQSCMWVAIAPLLFAISLHAQQSLSINTLLPQPTKLQASAGALPLTSLFTVASNAVRNPVLASATRRMLDEIEQKTSTQLSKTLGSETGNATLTITLTDPTPQRPTLETDESYTLNVTASRITLQAANVFGALHGLETIKQLVEPQNGVYVIPAVSITDNPRFPWRGLMLDVGRHFLPLPVIYRTIDAMAAVKLNVLHLHLTEDQGFRLESKRFPRLTEMGSDGLFYTQEQMRSVIAYASAHGVRIVPEFDVPGHVTSWLVGYPELGSMPHDYKIGRTFGVWDPALDPTKESTYKFLDSFIEEMAALFPDEYMHMGGDESNGKDWKANPAIAAYMQQHKIKSTDDLQVYFSTRVLALVKKHKKQMVGWDEILQPNTPKDAIIQSWRGAASLNTAASQGNRSILSAPYYLDAMKTAERMYLDDPIPADSKLTPEQTKLILGGEVTMWAEQVTQETVDSRVWPRTAALAERFWSPQNVRDVDDLYRRLEVESIRLDALGLTHISVPNMGLRQLAGSERGAAQLAVLISTLTPASFHFRYEQQKTSQLTPMGNVVDFTRPDPPLRQDFRLLVERYLHTTDAEHELARQQLESLFHAWIATRPSIDALALDHPLLNGVKLRREQLPQLGFLGVQSLGFIEAKSPPDPAWVQTQAVLLKQAAEPHDIVDFVVLPPLQSLLDASQQH